MAQDVILLNDAEQTKDIQWEEIKKEVENLYSSWATIAIDLASVGANNDDIIQFNSVLDDVAKSVKEENKDASLANMAKLYSLIPKYMESYSEDELDKRVINTKNYLLSAYALVDSEKWSEIDAELVKADESFSKVVNELNTDSNKELNISRSYLLLKELQKSTSKQDKQIFYLRYKNVLQELNVI